MSDLKLTLPVVLKRLSETNTWLFEEIFKAFDQEEIEEAFECTMFIMTAGGEMTADGSRPRTAGGIMVRLLREESPDKMAPILREQQAWRRKAAEQRLLTAAIAQKEEIRCPPEVLAQLIGKGGKAITAMRKKTGCGITVDTEKSAVRVDGPGDQAAGRQEIQKRIRALVALSHDYSEAVLHSDFMREEPAAPWAEALHQWVTEAVENTPAAAMAARLRALVERTPRATVDQVAAQLEAKPDLVGSRKVTEAVLAACHASTPAVVTEVVAEVLAAVTPSKAKSCEADETPEKEAGTTWASLLKGQQAKPAPAADADAKPTLTLTKKKGLLGTKSSWANIVKAA